MNDFQEYSYEQMLNADEWTMRAPGRMEGEPIEITEPRAIEIALRALCGDEGRAVTIIMRFKHPVYMRRPDYVQQTSGRPGPDAWGWNFWFPFPLPPNFEGKSFNIFVDDPSGVVEFADAI